MSSKDYLNEIEDPADSMAIIHTIQKLLCSFGEVKFNISKLFHFDEESDHGLHPEQSDLANEAQPFGSQGQYDHWESSQ